MFFNSIKEMNRLKNKEINRLRKEINRLRKEMNRLLSKRMSNTYLKITIETFTKLRFSEFKNFFTRLVFWEQLQLMQISLNF